MTITDADRKAAGDVVYEHERGSLTWFNAELHRERIASGDWDTHPVVQAFARHREAARREALEDAAKVAQGMGTNYDSCAGERYATAIRALIEKEPT